MKNSLLALVAVFAFLTAVSTTQAAVKDHPKELLWPEGAPGALGKEEVDQPWLWLSLAPADKANGTAVVVCPGGGYGGLAADYEGTDVAEWLNSLGVSAVVLKYRLGPRYHHPTPLNDAQRAIRYVRSKADAWHIDPKRVGILGFSAGGHLASTAATHFDAGKSDASDPIDRQSCRPDFAVLCYPVVTMSDPFTHGGSRNNLLGPNPDPKLVENLSNEKQVTPQTPPTFIFQTNEDTAVPAENAVMFYLALRKAHVPAEMHIYEKGQHGVGMAVKNPVLSTWTGHCADWLKLHGLLTKS